MGQCCGMMFNTIAEADEVIMACEMVADKSGCVVSFQFPGYAMVGKGDVKMRYLAGGASAQAVVAVEPTDTTLPSLVVRFQNPNVTNNVSDAVSNAAGQLGAAPARYYRGPLPTGAQVGVMEMMKGGCPGPQFLGESKKNAELFGACIGRFHGVDPAVLAPFEQVNSIKPDTAAILKQELGVDDHELAQIESICGTMPGRFSQILLLRQQGAHPAFLQRIGAAIKRTCLGACSWLSHPVAKRMVVGHADVNHNNLMYKDADYMVAIDFESARLMPAVFDLGAMLLDVNRAGISTFAVPRLHREAMVQAYKRLMPSGTEESTPVSTDGVLLDDRIDDLLWDMEVGMLFRLCYITIAAPIISRTVQKPTDQFVAALEVMLTAMEDAASDPTKKDAIIDRGLVAHCFVKEESVSSPGDGEKTNFI